jgi:phosphate transport system protein
MFDGVSLMLKGSIDNLVDPSLLEAERLCRNDSNIDSLLEGVRSDLLSNMEQSPSITSRAVDLLRVFCYLEEIADLCTELMRQPFISI